MQLRGKTAITTGAGHGIGTAIPLSTRMPSRAPRGTYDNRILIRHYGLTHEVAAAVFLVGPRISYICGETINVDGGWFAAGRIQHE